jgi:hypothetical protein
LVIGFAVKAPFADAQLVQIDGFVPAIEAMNFVTDLVTAGLLFSIFPIMGLRASVRSAEVIGFVTQPNRTHGIFNPGKPDFFDSIDPKRLFGRDRHTLPPPHICDLPRDEHRRARTGIVTRSLQKEPMALNPKIRCGPRRDVGGQGPWATDTTG